MIYPTILRSESKRFVRIAVIDTGFTAGKYSNVILCPDSKDFTNTDIDDKIGHGSHITNTIVDRIKDKTSYCILVLKYFDNRMKLHNSTLYTINAFKYAVNNGADVINYSSSGYDSDKEESDVIKLAISKGIKVNVSAGNDGLDLNRSCNVFPPCYNILGLNVVGNGVKDKNLRRRRSNYGTKVITEWEDGNNVLADTPTGPQEMSGTSMSCAIATAKTVNRMLGK